MPRRFKKITLPILTGFISLQISIFFCFGIITGYLIAKYFSSKIGSIQIPIGQHKIHLHHWMIALSGLTAVLLTNAQNLFPLFALGLSGGFVFQGIYCYNDWYRIFKRR